MNSCFSSLSKNALPIPIFERKREGLSFSSLSKNALPIRDLNRSANEKNVSVVFPRMPYQYPRPLVLALSSLVSVVFPRMPYQYAGGILLEGSNIPNSFSSLSKNALPIRSGRGCAIQVHRFSSLSKNALPIH